VLTYSGFTRELLLKLLLLSRVLDFGRGKKQLLLIKMVVDCEKPYNPLLLFRRSVPHVVVFPFPAQGHIRPFLQFSRTLVAEYDMHVTFVTTAPHLDRCRRALLQLEEDVRFKAHSRNNIQLVCLEMAAESGKTTSFVGLERTVRNLRDIFAEVMKGLIMAASSSYSSFVGTVKNPPGGAPPTTHHFGPPSCIISDMFLGWTQVGIFIYPNNPNFMMITSIFKCLNNSNLATFSHMIFKLN
jgi:hypothetical protein